MAACSAPAKNWLSLHIRESDKLVLVQWEKSLVEAVQTTITKLWPMGIQEKQETSAYTFFKLSGRPFSEAIFSEEIEERAQASQLLLEIIADLDRADWFFSFSCMILQSSGENASIWFFEKRQRTEKPLGATFAISIRANDRIAITNADENYPILKETVAPWVQVERALPNYSQIKLFGNPWQYFDWEETVKAGTILLKILRRLSEQEYRLNGVANVRLVSEMMLFEKAASVSRDQFTAMFLIRSDRIRLIDVPPNSKLIEIVRDCILKHWYKGIQEFQAPEQNEVPNSGICVGFKLRGNPWAATGAQDSRSAKFFFIELLKTLLESEGWETYREFVTARVFKDRACIFLRRCNPVSLPHFGIWLRKSDRVEILNADQTLTELFAHTVRSNWPREIQSEGVTENGYELKLRGKPWVGNTEDAALGCRLLTVLLETFNGLGWKVIAAPDLNWAYEQHGLRVTDDRSIWVFAYTACQKTADYTSAPTYPPVLNDLPPSYDEAMKHEKL